MTTDNKSVVENPDVSVSGGGSLYMVQPISQEAKDWVEENVQLEGWQWMGPAFGVEWRIRKRPDGLKVLDAGLVVAGGY